MTLPPDLSLALRTIPALALVPADQWRIERLGSVTNRNYRLSHGKEPEWDDYVLRLPGAGTSSYLNRSAGIHNATQAAAIDIAPPVVYADAERGWQLSRFLPDCRPLTTADLADPSIRAAIGRLLGRLQGAARNFQHEMRPFAISDRYLELAPRPDLMELRRAARWLEDEIEQPAIALVPAHIDPNPTNFLLAQDGALHLIDWEFSAMADPCWDLAAIALEGSYEDGAVADLLAAAGHEASPVMRRRIDLFRCALALVASSWAYVEIAAGNDSADLEAFAMQRQVAFGRRLEALAAGT